MLRASPASSTKTPTVVVNGRVLVGERPIEKFRALIDEALKEAQ